MSPRPRVRDLARSARQAMAQSDQRRWQRTSPLWRALMQAAHADVDDVEAVAWLAPILARRPREAAGTVERVRRIRERSDGYIPDRALRLVTAAVEGAAPKPIDPAHAELFAREQELGRLPLAAAYQRLEARVPQLADLCREVSAGERNWVWQLEQLIGPRCGLADALLSSTLAEQVAAAWLAHVAEERGARDPARPIWDLGSVGEDGTGARQGADGS